VSACGLLLAAFALWLAACGGVSGQTAVEASEPCIAPDGEEEGIDGTPPAHPIAIGPEGPVTGLRRELDGSALYVYDPGVCSVVETAPGTWALTSIVVDEQDAPVPGATVILEALEPDGLDVQLVARTDEDGAFAFVNVPIEGERSCYRTRVLAAGFRPYADVDVYTPQSYAGNVFLSRNEYDDGLGTDRRACAAHGAP
jgi:hypothetical protein